LGETRSCGGNYFLTKASAAINAEQYLKKLIIFSEKFFMSSANNFSLLGFTKAINNECIEL